MKSNTMLVATSLVSILLFSLHFTGDVVHGMEPGTMRNLGVVPILVVWLCGALILAERRSGHVIMLLGAILAAGMPLIHLRGAGLGGAFARQPGAFFFIWVVFALGVSGTFSIILALRALLRPRSGTH